MAGKHDEITNWPTRSGAARVLGCSAELVTVLLNAGKLRFIGTRAGKLIDPADLERLRREREARAESRGR